MSKQASIAYIDGQAFPLEPGETILNFIKRHQGKGLVPTLCDAPNLDPFGSCRVCSVEVALEPGGPTKTQASCHTPAMANSYIYTSTESLQRLRKNIVELVLTDHPLDCLTCEVNGNCELQSVAAQVGIRDVRYPEGATHLDREKDLSHPYLTSDLSKCINCYRCVRVCDEVQGNFVLSMAGRGFDNHIIKGLDQSFMDSDCVSCGGCAQVCPTSAISDVFESKAVLAGEVKTRTVCSYCGVGCNLEVKTVDGVVKSIQAPYEAEVNEGHTCLKGRYAFSFYNHPDRLTAPLLRKNGELVEVSWDEALDFIADKVQTLVKEHGPDSLAFISSSRGTNEENYLMQKLARAVVGTNNIDCCARVCHSPTALGMQRTFGTGAATNSIEDIKVTDCIMVIGANPTSAHPVTGVKIKQFAIKGKPLIVIDPRRTRLAKYATHHLQLNPGSNVAMLNMLLYYIISEGLVDEDFVANRTSGYDAMKQHILSLDIDEMERITGVSKALAKDAAVTYASAGNAMSFHGLGVTEHSQGTFTVMQIADLAMITGNVGRPGVGVNPLRGQNNVQGAADMGCQPNLGAGYLDVHDPAISERYALHYGRPMPMGEGLKIPEMFNESLSGNLKAMWLMGEDIAQTDPNTCHVLNALDQLDLLVVQEIFLTETCNHATVVLPAASFLEKSGTFTNGERRIQRVQAAVEPLPGTKTDGQIIVEIMRRLGYDQPDYDAAEVLQEVAGIVPFFEGVTWDNLGDDGRQWPVTKEVGNTKVLHQEEFKIGKGRFHSQTWRMSEEILQHSEDYPYIITTNRDLEHYNAGTMTRRTRNVDLHSEDLLLIHPEDAATHGIQSGDYVFIESPRGQVYVKADITEDMLPGVMSSTFHFPEIMLNRITSNVCDTETLCPEFKVVSCRIQKHEGPLPDEPYVCPTPEDLMA